ncbi:MAG: hypothetical protein SPI35_07830 [Porphyromonas sp.]|nr:hypothetical protein [Porphyromonas sp.]
MLRRIRKPLLLGILLIGFLWATHGQQIATTSDGTQVILYNDGTWEYASRQIGNRPSWDIPNDAAVWVAPGTEYRSAEITINKEVRFKIENGILENVQLLHRGFVVYDHQTGVVDRSFFRRVKYDMKGRVERLGNWGIEYDFLSGAIKKIGRYPIEHSFITNKIERVGSLKIEYEFDTERIKRIGNMRIEYDFFSKQVEEIKGENKGVQILIY